MFFIFFGGYQIPGPGAAGCSVKWDECTFDGGFECLQKYCPWWLLDAVRMIFVCQLSCFVFFCFFYCNWYTVITSHLVNCLLPQKCFKFKFYITVLMFYKWCTSCLCIICPTLVIKAQSLNFILSHCSMNFSLEEISFWSLVNHFIGWLQAEKKKKDCRLWLCIQLRTFELLSFRFELSVVCTERIACRFTCRRFYFNILTASSSLWDDEKCGHGLVPIIVSLRWVHFIFSCVPLTLAITYGVGLDNAPNWSN